MRTLNNDRSETVKVFAGGLTKLRGPSDNLPQQWWAASTVIPLVAATIGPLSNTLAIAALASPWRMTLPNGGIPSNSGRGSEDEGVGIADPPWELVFNALALACGFAGNLLLLLNFTSRVRYIVALPLVILCWFLSALMASQQIPLNRLIAVIAVMHVHIPPAPPEEIYSQGFWHAVLASCLYLIGSGILSINLLGYLRGHYPQQFDLDDTQRTLILQTTTFFFWLAGGSAIFSAIEDFNYADALYYADVSVLTIGFGDFAPQTDQGRGFLLVFQLVGVIFLGLVISSIAKFALNIGADRIIKHYRVHARASTVGHAGTSERKLRERLGLPPRPPSSCLPLRPERTVTFAQAEKSASIDQVLQPPPRPSVLHPCPSPTEKRRRRRQKLLLLRRERDKFDATRRLQTKIRRWKQYRALLASLAAFTLLWTLGALLFLLTESHMSPHQSYFESLYFTFCALLTIGYGDVSPKSAAGKPLFVVWSLAAVPVVTVLVLQMSCTVVAAVNRGTFTLADWTIMPRRGVVASFLKRHPALHGVVTRFFARRRVRRGFLVQDPGSRSVEPAGMDLEEEGEGEDGDGEEAPVPEGPPLTEHDVAEELTGAIKGVAHDLRRRRPRRYTYDEWKRFIGLMRFGCEQDRGGVEGGVSPWDWIGEDSPLLANITEAEWVLDRLCESLNRYTRRQADKMEGVSFFSRLYPPPRSG
ncbi:voltage-gated potassium channel [Podospora conica]|nr:voltage-gated potassium channel [Schizothecium conicum]